MREDDNRIESGNSVLSDVARTFIEDGTFLKKFIARFLPVQQDIEDVAQEAFLRAYIAEQQKPIKQPRAFLFRVAKNLALTRLTREHAKVVECLDEVGVSIDHECGGGTVGEVEAQQSLGLYCEAVAMLPQKGRQVFLLRKVHGLSQKEVANRMRLSVASVDKYLRQGVLTCQEHLRHHENYARPLAKRSRPAADQGRHKE